MPIVTIKTAEGLLTKEKKQTLHKRITDLLVEIEGDSKPEFAGFVIVNIKGGTGGEFQHGRYTGIGRAVWSA
jgi:phenylpyruvate tautomerase PptA (4-oxalocrotonate tautomerase family)